MLALFVLAHFSHHVVMALITPLTPYIRDYFQIDYTRAGALISACTIAYGISQLPAGWLADRFGPRILITLGVSGVAVVGILVGLSPGYYVMIALLILLGITGGGYHPSASPAISAMFPSQMQGRALGIHQIGGSGSFFLAPMIAIGLAAAFGWRGSFIGVSIPVIVFGLILYALLGRREISPYEKKKSAPGDIHTPAIAGKKKLVAFLALGILIQVLVFSILAFVPLYMVDNFGASEVEAGSYLSIVYFVGLWAGPMGGYLSDRFGRIKVMLAASIACGPVIGLLCLSAAIWQSIILLMMLGVFMFMTMPIAEVYIINNTTPARRSTILGVYYLCSRGIPGIVTILLGVIFDNYGFNAGFIVMGAIMVITTIVFGLFFTRKHRGTMVSS